MKSSGCYIRTGLGRHSTVEADWRGGGVESGVRGTLRRGVCDAHGGLSLRGAPGASTHALSTVKNAVGHAVRVLL